MTDQDPELQALIDAPTDWQQIATDAAWRVEELEAENARLKGRRRERRKDERKSLIEEMEETSEGRAIMRNAEYSIAYEHVEELEATIQRVRDLHSPIPTEAITASDCVNEDCDHEDGCPTETVHICAECDRIADEIDVYYGERSLSQTVYPCPTIQALEGDPA